MQNREKIEKIKAKNFIKFKKLAKKQFKVDIDEEIYSQSFGNQLPSLTRIQSSKLQSSLNMEGINTFMDSSMSQSRESTPLRDSQRQTDSERK